MDTFKTHAVTEACWPGYTSRTVSILNASGYHARRFASSLRVNNVCHLRADLQPRTVFSEARTCPHGLAEHLYFGRQATDGRVPPFSSQAAVPRRSCRTRKTSRQCVPQPQSVVPAAQSAGVVITRPWTNAGRARSSSARSRLKSQLAGRVHAKSMKNWSLGSAQVGALRAVVSGGGAGAAGIT